MNANTDIAGQLTRLAIDKVTIQVDPNLVFFLLLFFLDNPVFLRIDVQQLVLDVDDVAHDPIPIVLIFAEIVVRTVVDRMPDLAPGQVQVFSDLVDRVLLAPVAADERALRPGRRLTGAALA